VKKEAYVNFLTDPLEERSTLRSVDVLVYDWNRKEKCMCGFDWSFSPCEVDK
jgi:hypothetical protein